MQGASGSVVAAWAQQGRRSWLLGASALRFPRAGCQSHKGKLPCAICQPCMHDRHRGLVNAQLIQSAGSLLHVIIVLLSSTGPRSLAVTLRTLMACQHIPATAIDSALDLFWLNSLREHVTFNFAGCDWLASAAAITTTSTAAVRGQCAGPTPAASYRLCTVPSAQRWSRHKKLCDSFEGGIVSCCL